MNKINSGLQLSRKTVFEKDMSAVINSANESPQKDDYADAAIIESREALTNQHSMTLDNGFGLTKSSGMNSMVHS